MPALWDYILAGGHGTISNKLYTRLASLVAQMVKNLPAMQETQVQSLDQEDALEKGMATHSSILAWRIPWSLQTTGHGIAKSQTQLSHSHDRHTPCATSADVRDEKGKGRSRE